MLCLCGHSASFKNKLLVPPSPAPGSMCGPHNSAATKHHWCQVALTPLCSLPGPPAKPSAISGRGPSTMPFLTDRPSLGPSSPELSAAPVPKHPPRSPLLHRSAVQALPEAKVCSTCLLRPGWVLRRVYLGLFGQTGAKRCGESPRAARCGSECSSKRRSGEGMG